MDGVWSQTELNRLIEMVLNGHTAREIADDIGTTRNAVIGKAKRKKIKWPGRQDPKPKVAKIVRVKKEKALPAIKKDKIAWKDMISSQPTSVPDNGCMFPIGDGWCGCPTRQVYCQEHHAVVYRKPERPKITARFLESVD